MSSPRKRKKTPKKEPMPSNDEGSDTSVAMKAAASSPPKESSSKKEPPSPASTSTTATPKKDSGDGTAPKKTPSSSSRPSKTYTEMIHEAIVALKDRTGSSVPAIKKYMLQEYPHLEGPHFKNRFNTGLKTGVKTERFQKVRQSFKISAKFKEKERSKKRKAVEAKKKAASAAAERNKKKPEKKLEEKELSPEELAKAKAKLAAKKAAEKKKAEQERLQRERAERIRKRKFPMEDTKLHLEDKELNVKPPSDVISRPYLPYFWQVTLPLDDPARKGKTSDSILRHSKVDHLDLTNRGLVPDLLQVYHFFTGDVNFATVTALSEDETIVAPFKLANLIYATDEIIQGNTKRSRMIPPLISHLFVVALQLLCQAPEADVNTDDKVERSWNHFRKELNKYLLPALNAGSWPDICFLYMDAMERFYTMDVSLSPNSLSPMQTDLSYLLGLTDERSNTDEGLPPLPNGYGAYFGDYRGALYKAHEKLGRQEAWLLTAEEIICLLRALTDDVLATYPDIVNDLSSREEEMQVLLKAKREADNKFRRVRLAYEGPKKRRPAASTAITAPDSEKKEEAATGTGENEEAAEPAFKPTATKKQFEAAQKAQLKAHEAYEKGIRRLVARTEPIGYDRDYNAVYCFRHDPEVIYVEDKRAPARLDDTLAAEMQQERRSWHVIETTSLFDVFTASLDVRGKREHDLYEALLGPSGHQHSMRRFLHDDVKVKTMAEAKIKEMETLKRKLETAKIKCDEEKGRRSGRLADQAEIELAAIQAEIEEFEKEPERAMGGERASRDFYDLTGIYTLEKFENAGRVATRRTREKKVSLDRPIPLIRCSKMVPTGNIDGSGLVGLMVSTLLEIEERCEKLAPWEKKAFTRASWISRLEENVHSWHTISPFLLGPDHADTSVTSPSDPKKRRKDQVEATNTGFGAPTVSSIQSHLRQAILELENRVADLTNVTQATHDADVADENMSVEDNEDQDETEKQEKAWKRYVHRISEMPARRFVQIREALVAAISAARKAHVPDVVSELRAALLLYHPNAAKDCKDAAVKVLVKHGGYDPSDDEDDDESTDDNAEEKEEEVSVLSAEAVTLQSCLGGSDDATRADWVEAVKQCKTLSRLASLCAAFCDDATKRLAQMEVDRDNLLAALTVWERETKSRKSPTRSKAAASEVWANVKMTEEICMARGGDFGWWPARMCEVKEKGLAASLASVERCLVALFGEMGAIRVVHKSDVVPFDGNIPDIPEEEGDQSEAPLTKEIRGQLDDCMAMARRVLRSQKKKKKSK